MDYNNFIRNEKIKDIKIQIALSEDKNEKIILKLALLDIEN